MLCTAFLCLSDRLMLLLYTVTLSLCLLLKLNDVVDDDDDDYAAYTLPIYSVIASLVIHYCQRIHPLSVVIIMPTGTVFDQTTLSCAYTLLVCHISISGSFKSYPNRAIFIV